MANKVLAGISFGVTLVALGLIAGAIYSPHWVDYEESKSHSYEYGLFMVTDDDNDLSVKMSGQYDTEGQSWSCMKWYYCEFYDEFDHDIDDGLCKLGKDMAKAALIWYICYMLAICFMVKYMICQLAIMMERDGATKMMMIGKAVMFTVLAAAGFGSWWGISGASYSADCEYDDVGDDLNDGDKPDTCAGTGATIMIIAFAFTCVAGILGVAGALMQSDEVKIPYSQEAPMCCGPKIHLGIIKLLFFAAVALSLVAICVRNWVHFEIDNKIVDDDWDGGLFTVSDYDLTGKLTVGPQPTATGGRKNSPVIGQTTPIVVVSQRTILNGVGDNTEYLSRYASAWKYFDEAIPGFQALVTVPDKTNYNLVHDVQVFANMDAFMGHVDYSNPDVVANLSWGALYDPVHPMTGYVYGGWDDRAITETAGFGAQFTFCTAQAGFIRNAFAGRKGPPTIVSSQRRVKAGQMTELLKWYDYLADFYETNDYGVLAFLASPDATDDTLMHDLQIFADDAAFKSHADTTIPEVKKGFDGLFANYDFTRSPTLGGTAISNDPDGVDAETSANGASFDVYGYTSKTGGIDLTNSVNVDEYGWDCLAVQPCDQDDDQTTCKTFEPLMNAGRLYLQLELVNLVLIFQVIAHLYNAIFHARDVSHPILVYALPHLAWMIHLIAFVCWAVISDIKFKYEDCSNDEDVDPDESLDVCVRGGPVISIMQLLIQVVAACYLTVVYWKRGASTAVPGIEMPDKS